MAKTSGELEQEFIQTAGEKTGKSVAQWLPVIKKTGLLRQMEIVNWLKSDHNLNHLEATLLAGLYLNKGKPVYQDEKSLLENQFKKCGEMRPLYNEVVKKILAAFPQAQLIPKKTYLSITATREFAAINIRKTELRLGVDLGEEPFTDNLQKAKLTGPMPRISHMVIVNDLAQFDNKTMKYIDLSYKRTHKN